MAEKILTPVQKKFISLFAKNRYLKERFYLTGGTALAAYYLNHRYSEDLDFFFILQRYQNISFSSLLKSARIKFDTQIDPIQLGSQLVKAKEISDLPRMIKKIDNHKWRSYFISKAKSLSSNIFK